MIRLLPIALLGACAAPDAGELFSLLDVSVAPDAMTTHAAFIASIEGAESELAVCLPAIEDPDLAQAIVDAWDRGVMVEVVTDIDREADVGVTMLEDAGVPLTLADDGLSYFDFSLNEQVTFFSPQIRMSHAWTVADRTEIVAASTAGDLTPGPRVVFEAVGEDLGDDMRAEHHQIFGGADATAITAFNGLQKASADSRWIYPTDSEVTLEMWFGPQERIIKRIIDGIYSATSDVRVITNDFADEGMARALQSKAAFGFDAEVIVGPGFGTVSSSLSSILRNATPDVRKRKIEGLEHLPTVVLVDFGEGRDRQHHTARAYILTHEVVSAARLYDDLPVMTDQLIDGTLWVLNDTGAPGDQLQLIESLYTDLLARSEAL